MSLYELKSGFAVNDILNNMNKVNFMHLNYIYMHSLFSKIINLCLTQPVSTFANRLDPDQACMTLRFALSRFN